MQSSPPERASKRPYSPTGTQYSLDLAALDQESRSGASSPLPEQHIDRVRSEDIDGPSDFTLNMEKWFRGGTMGRGTTKSRKKGLASLRETGDESVQANEGLLTPRKVQDEQQSASHHTPSNSPPLESVFDMRPSLGQNQAQDQHTQDLSEWDPYTDGEESTPQPPAHKQFLQPTVEDYHSEFTPARMPSMRRTKSTSSHTHVAGEDSPYAKEEPSSPGRPSSETMSPVRSPERSPARSPVLHRSAPRQFSSQSTEAAFEKQMEDLQTKCKQLELLNARLSQAVDEERRMRTEEKTVHEKRLADAGRRESELNEMKEQAYTQRDASSDYNTALRTRLDALHCEREQDRPEQERMRGQHADIRKMTEDHQLDNMKLQAKIRALEQDVELACRSRDAAEESERAMRAELEKQTVQPECNEDDDLDRMQSDLTQIEDPDDRVHELQEELRETKAQMEKLRAAKKDAEDETSDVRAEMAGLQRAHDEETSRLAADQRRAVAFAEDLQTQLEKLREQLQSEGVAHKAEIDRLREGSGVSAATSSGADLEALRNELDAKQTDLNTAVLERDALRDDLEAQQSKLNAAILERDEAQDALSSVEVSLQEANDTLADREAVSAAIDAKVSAAIAKREAYWRGRLETSEKERKVMVKALLRQWGREELGVTESSELDGRQGYEYQFMKKARRSSGVDAKAGA